MSSQYCVEIQKCKMLVHSRNSSENLDTSDLLCPSNLFEDRTADIVHERKSYLYIFNNISGFSGDLFMLRFE